MAKFKSDAYWHSEIMLLTSEGSQESYAEKGAILWLPLLRCGQV